MELHLDYDGEKKKKTRLHISGVVESISFG